MSFCLKRKKNVCIFIFLNSFYLDFIVEPVLVGLFLTYLIFVLKYVIFALLGLSWEIGIAKGVKGLEKHEFVGVKLYSLTRTWALWMIVKDKGYRNRLSELEH